MIFVSLFLKTQIANSVVMNHVTIADGCSIQGSVVCSTVQLQERVVLKDCQVIPCARSYLRFCRSHLPLLYSPISVYSFECELVGSTQVGAGFVVTAGSEYKGESLAKKEKSISI